MQEEMAPGEEDENMNNSDLLNVDEWVFKNPHSCFRLNWDVILQPDMTSSDVLSFPVEALSVQRLQPVRLVLLWMSVCRSWSSCLKSEQTVHERDWWIQMSLMMKALQRVSRLLFVVYFIVLVQ